tara:strand:- start:4027 stop:4218 length:192 start_codon:yes stop_codon:yes gene_type:complete
MPIKFEHTKAKTEDGEYIYAIELYKGFDEEKLGYVETLNPMSLDELQELKKYLSEMIWKECSY